MKLTKSSGAVCLISANHSLVGVVTIVVSNIFSPNSLFLD